MARLWIYAVISNVLGKFLIYGYLIVVTASGLCSPMEDN
nr:MAG TPA: hypothetical protein [Caudoviricetes sp.]